MATVGITSRLMIDSTGPKVLVFSGLVAASLAIWWNSLAQAVALAWNSEAYTHILLVLPLCTSLIYLSVKGHCPTLSFSRWKGTSLLAAVFSLCLLARLNVWHWSADEILSLEIFALVSWWIGSLLLCFGIGIFRRLLFPLCFLFLLVPCPQTALTMITQFLQQQSAVFAGALFRLASTPVTRDGIFLSIPGLDIEVGRECSSIRSSMMLLIVTTVVAQLFLKSRWKRVLMVLLVVPLAVAKNAVRIVTIAELGTRVDPSFLNGRLHRQGGIVFLGIAFAIMLAILWCLNKVNRSKNEPRPVPEGQCLEGGASL